MKVYENLDRALEAIKEISFSKGFPVYYRGQNKDYHITSSLHRLPTNDDIKKAANKTNAFIQWIKEQNTLLPSVSEINVLLHGTDLVYWAIAQHYGYKTDLIDFTTSIETASAFSLLGRNVGDTGVIYCLWEDDIQELIRMYSRVDESFDPKSRELLKAFGFNPFFEFKIYELSRITNQHGLFLWDLNGIISIHWNQMVMNNQEWVDSHCFYFHQTDKCIDISLLRAVYPEPNYIEIIIDQYVQIENHYLFYKDYGELIDADKILSPLSTNHCQSHFLKNDLSVLRRIFYHNENIFYPHEGMQTCLVNIDFPFISKLETDEGALDFVKSWFQSLNKNKYCMYTGKEPTVKLYSELINEVLALKGIFPKFNEDVLQIILQKVISILGSLLLLTVKNSPQAFAQAYVKLSEYKYDLNDTSHSIDSILDILREHVCLNDLAADVWKNRCIFLKVIGSNNTISFGVVPSLFIEDLSSDYRKRQLETIKLLYEQGILPATQIEATQSGVVRRVLKDKESLSIVDLFNFVSVPDILFDAADMFRVMVYCFIPWQIVMCPKRCRAYDPSEYKEIRLMESENFPDSEVYYWGGAYVIIGRQSE